ncbi:membrane protein [Paramyrothecium foliicola]|nr:membrane protein [Paramyrothecium foliicola]
MARVLLPFLSALSVAQALYFYIDGSTPKCFFEELPKDTLVVGHYTAEEWSEQTNTWKEHDGISIYISVDVRAPQFGDIVAAQQRQRFEIFNNDHRVLSQRGSSAGRFTFTAHEAGDHKICFTASSSSGNPGWLSTNNPQGGIKLILDLVIGESNQIESTDKGKLQDLTSRVKDLNARLADIRKEQVFQREREAQFRDQSEATNSRVIRWILIQLAVLGITCAWQLSHLRSFFIKQKLT